MGNEAVLGVMLIGVVALGAGCPQKVKRTGPVDGKALFAEYCAQCHGADGKAQVEAGKAMQARDLSLPEVQALPDDRIRYQIKYGRGRMPAIGSAFDDEQLTALVGYVRQFGSAGKAAQ